MALSCTWGGYADTDLDFTEFFGSDHTVAARFMLQYPNAYTGPMLSLNGTGTYLIGQGDFLANPFQQAKLVMNIGTGQVTYPVNLPAGTWHHLAVVRNGTLFQMYLDGQPTGASLTVPATDLPVGRLRIGKNMFDAAVDGGVLNSMGCSMMSPSSGRRCPPTESPNSPAPSISRATRTAFMPAMSLGTSPTIRSRRS